MKHRVGCVTDTGNYRSKNQDRIMCNHMLHGKRMISVACVCDGIGSFANSEIAAEMVVRGIDMWFKGVATHFPENIDTNELVEDLETTICELNELVCEYIEDHNEKIGCTMSLILFVDSDYFIFHVGDSRIYCLWETLEQLTQDEVVLRQVNGRDKLLLANYVGKEEALCMRKKVGHANPGDIFLAGTDGLYKKLQEEDIPAIYEYLESGREIVEICGRLILSVLERGERDNVSCAIVQMTDKEW